MPFVIPALIVGGAYVTGKLLEVCGEMYKADTLKNICDEAPETMGGVYNKMMDSFKSSLSI